MKATSIFGGVQVVQILVQIIRSKAVAVLLGPAGMGIISLLQSTIGLIQSLTNFGLQTSAVKNVAEANSTGDKTRVALVVTVLKRWIWLTGLLGTFLTLVFSPWLSKLTFGNNDYTLAFMWISISLLFNQLSAGQLVLLKGLRKIKYLANANLTGAFIGLGMSVPMYYFWGIDGIVPAIIATSFANMIRSWYFARKVKIESVKTTRQVTLSEGREMLTMGFTLSLSGFFTVGAAYLLRIFIGTTGSLEHVGLFGAGFAIIESYVGMVFTAMGTDYYPRLSAVNKNDEAIRDVVTNQAIIAVLILIPIILLFIAFLPFVIKILYSNQFIDTVDMIRWGIMGSLLKAVSWSMGFIILAKSDHKLLIKTSLGFSTIFLINNMLGYYLGGITGIGVSYVINYFIHMVGLLIITKFRYHFKFREDIYPIVLFGSLLCGGMLIVVFLSDVFQYLLGSVLITTGIIFSAYHLNKKLGIFKPKNTK